MGIGRQIGLIIRVKITSLIKGVIFTLIINIDTNNSM